MLEEHPRIYLLAAGSRARVDVRHCAVRGGNSLRVAGLAPSSWNGKLASRVVRVFDARRPPPRKGWA
eukprot:jgi/Tetstr1/441147/TSEL_029408.t1